MRVALPGRLDSAARARAALEHLDRIMPSGALEDLRLMVSELVTNSLIHSGMGADESIHLRLDADREMARAEVEDPGHGLPYGPRPTLSLENPGGRGLRLVDRLAARWGVSRTSGTCVWLEIDLAGDVR